jgi:hypothetical protein
LLRPFDDRVEATMFYAWKVALIEKVNPNWDDLYPSLAA